MHPSLQMKESTICQDERVTFPPSRLKKEAGCPTPPPNPKKKKGFHLETSIPLKEDELNFPQGGFIV